MVSLLRRGVVNLLRPRVVSLNRRGVVNMPVFSSIKESLSLSLDKKSLLIYGDNGTGKSSITDSIEWFYKDKIAHLAGNEIGKDSIRNIFITDTVDSKIGFQFSDNRLDTEKSIDN